MWLESASFVGLHLRMSAESSDGVAAYYLMIQLARLQYGVAAAFRDMTAVDADSTSERDVLASLLGQSNAVHAFLVLANTYWSVLKELLPRLAIPEMSTSIAEHAAVIEATNRARSNYEHLTERILKGRSGRFGEPMSAEVVRQAIGRLSGCDLVFGGDTFNLRFIYDAIATGGADIGARIHQALQDRFTSEIVPRTVHMLSRHS
jgi:hypothetical protein